MYNVYMCVHGLAMAIRAHPCEQRSTLALTVAKRYVYIYTCRIQSLPKADIVEWLATEAVQQYIRGIHRYVNIPLYYEYLESLYSLSSEPFYNVSFRK